MKRRDFLKLGAQVGVAANVLPILMGGLPVRALGRSPLRSALGTASTNDNVLVIIQLAGGNDGLNTIIPFTDPLYKTNRPTLGITVDSSSYIPDHPTLAFHPQMASNALELYNASKMAIIQNVGYPNPNLSHFRGTDIWNTATDSLIYSSSGWIGRMLSGLNPNYPPSTIPTGSQPLAIQFGNSLSNLFLSRNGGMGIAINRLPTSSNPSIHNYDAIPASPITPGAELEYVRIIQSETEIYAQTIANRTQKTNSTGVTYPTGNLGTQLAGVAQLIKSGFSTKIYLVTQGGYDTHSNQLTGQAALLQELAGCMNAFQKDIEAFGVADKVATMTYSEFGRRPLENGSGTDHGTAAPLFIFGTNVIGGVRGHDPKMDTASLVSGNLAFDSLYDFRNIYSTVMSEWLGIDDSSIQNILTASNGSTFSSKNDWKKLGIFKSQQTGGVNDSADMTPGLMLMENYPNPVMSETTIEYALPEDGMVTLSIYNVKGVEVDRIVEARQSAGIHRKTFNARNLQSGAYIYRLSTSTGQISKQMVVVK
ncbi:MAG: DUF1501 domain-containing protein [bacterium]